MKGSAYTRVGLYASIYGSPQIVAGALTQIGHNKLLYLVENYIAKILFDMT